VFHGRLKHELAADVPFKTPMRGTASCKCTLCAYVPTTTQIFLTFGGSFSRFSDDPVRPQTSSIDIPCDFALNFNLFTTFSHLNYNFGLIFAKYAGLFRTLLANAKIVGD
jgi:hypothetical protein